MIQVYNTLAHRKVPLPLVCPGPVSIYVCGVTPYAEAHIGHARPGVIWDVIKRHLRRRGYLVRHIQNFTDIDDRLITAANQQGLTVEDVAATNMNRYIEQMKRLGIEPPDAYPRVTDNIPAIVDYIAVLVEKGFAYATAGGDVYFDVSRKPDYGKLSRRSADQQQAGERSTVNTLKRDLNDFALWKAAEPGEPSWASPWGLGRPGWHIECSAMSLRFLGEGIDLHGGGIDLIFPHHENEVAQSEAYAGKSLDTIFVHNGLVTLSDVKMSKSLGNGVGIESLLQHWPAEVIRTYLLSVHYRSPLAFDEARLGEWQKALNRVWSLFRETADLPPPAGFCEESWLPELLAFEQRFLETLDDDFNTAKALAMVFDLVRRMRPVIDQGGPAGHAAGYLTAKSLSQASAILGFLPLSQAPAREPEAEATLERLLAIRQQARLDGAYDRADAIRQLLLEIGWRIEDTALGTRLIAEEDFDVSSS